jgi:DNA-binding beta-propeller fold protein YncE
MLLSIKSAIANYYRTRRGNTSLSELQGIAINPNTMKIYVVVNGEENPSISNVTVINTTNWSPKATHRVIARVPIEGNPQDIAVNPYTNRIYVTDANNVVL